MLVCALLGDEPLLVEAHLGDSYTPAVGAADNNDVDDYCASA